MLSAMPLNRATLSRPAAPASRRLPQRPSRQLRLHAQADTTATRPTSEILANLKPGEYFKPPAEETSGFLGNSAKFKRSPCPALNVLANHGYINRDGTNLTTSGVIAAIQKVYNLDPTITFAGAAVIRILSYSFPPLPFSLSDLSTHEQAEHDSSLVHDDLHFGKDPSHPNPELVEQLIARSKDGETIKLPEVLEHRLARQADSKARNPTYGINPFLRFCACAESALFLNVLGHKESIPISHAKSFLIDEKLPEDFVRPDVTIMQGDLSPTMDKVKQFTQQPGQI